MGRMRDSFSPYWQSIQDALFPDLEQALGGPLTPLTAKQQQLAQTLEVIRIKQWIPASQAPAAGRPAPTASSAGYRSHRRRRQAPIVGTGSGPTRRPHAPNNGPGAPRRYATRATAPSSPHPPAACRQDRPRMQRLSTTAPSIRPIRTQSTPSDTFLVNPPSTARFADLRQNDRQRPLAPSADRRRRAGRRTPAGQLTSRTEPSPRRVGPAVLTHQQPQPPSRTLPVMILTATSPIDGWRTLLQHHDIVTGEAIVAGNVLEERHRAARRLCDRVRFG